ncbi:MAG: ornithine carbamoyltransferase [Candidatus Brocadiae bacterium]|nr:ornithine carbamoyltransferase [Candidatus Brocadiia bacterium]
MVQHLITLADWNTQQVLNVIAKAQDVKANPQKYSSSLQGKSLIMLFEKPSLRTHLSFDIGMYQLGGHSIYYNASNSPLGKGKESLSDTIRVMGRYADILMARMFSHQHLCEMAKHSTIPIINGLTNFSHPCQILGDLLTIKEKKGKLEGLKLAYFGDSNNNVTHSLLYGCAHAGMHIAVGCPRDENFCPNVGVFNHAVSIANGKGTKVTLHHNAQEAVKDADVVYTDSWMSYHVPPEEEKKRIDTLKPFQVNSQLMKHAKPDAIFMNCLPAMREYEQTAEVLDGPQSVVFDEAENRLHIQKAIMLTLLGK